jgi:hypothetical protein
MNTTDRILGESTASAFDDLIKLSSVVGRRENSSDEIFDMVREYERKHGLSEELFEIFSHIRDAAQNIEIAQSKPESRFGVGYEDAMEEFLDHYTQLWMRDLCYLVIKGVQTGKINMGSLLDKVLRGDAFNDGVDLRKLSPESRPYIDAIADTFLRPAVGVMATAETISHVGQWPLDYDNWDGPEDDGRAP